MDALAIFKLVSLVSIWVVGFVGGVLPFFIRQHNRVLMSLLNCMSGGVFLAGGFMHLLHAAIENPGLNRWSTMDEGVYAFPYAEMFCTIGFLGVLIVEQLAHALQAKAHSQHVHTDDEGDSDDRKMDSAPFLEQVEVVMPPAPKKGRKKSHDDHIPFDKHASGTVAFVLFVALSFHSVLEGLGIGAQSTPAWGVFLAIIIHKGLAAFALGTGMLKSQLSKAKFIAYMLLFSLMSIFGIIIGWAVNAAESSEDSAAAGICLALASGTFIYVAVMEIIPQEFAHGKSSPKKTLLLVAGYAIFGAIAKWS
ncbi:zinc (Zn2)-Iron (Fe2) Permease (ZIP) family [Achlya hypogyna]|uniref:Zinc (Zn2)-Iron (Fe2) Permease (ZIP) family n=1 Tax=Achlya hypogyna TaxID=1202772 RepID=A0A1V9ZN15_ACHHY|nr:zinc (Zn2)-Iron (Fe2) Permease (ZIP) family [Achlya hypogyna]